MATNLGAPPSPPHGRTEVSGASPPPYRLARVSGTRTPPHKRTKVLVTGTPKKLPLKCGSVKVVKKGEIISILSEDRSCLHLSPGLLGPPPPLQYDSESNTASSRSTAPYTNNSALPSDPRYIGRPSFLVDRSSGK